MVRVFLALSVLISLHYSNDAIAQGCSDAGLCSIQGMDGSCQDESTNKHKFSAGTTLGMGDNGTRVTGFSLSFEKQLQPKWIVSSKLTASSITGEMASTSGFGDLFLTSAYLLSSGSNHSLTWIAGCKVPIGKPSVKKNDYDLPMAYQPSLGSLDAMLGIVFHRNQMQVSIGIQQPLSGESDNAFLPESYPNAQAMKYPASNRINRKGDILARFTYTIPVFTSRLTNRVSLLPIYHLGEDTYSDARRERVSIVGSDGLTLNGNVVSSYRINERNSLEFSLGVPFVTRDVRPDGLTRSYVFGIEYTFQY
ncbi:MAG: hypothetical protein OEM52_06945 [bacterium]|nr:hypothetical protein [bacterium]